MKKSRICLAACPRPARPIVQGLSWALKEQMRFDRRAITSVDWSGYPIMGFDEVPPIEVVLLDRPNDPFLGAGEATVGPASAPLAQRLGRCDR